MITTSCDAASERPLVIIVHASVGSGHRSAANAVAQAFEDLAGSRPDLPAGTEIAVLDILDYVGEHLCENLSIDLIAGQFYISKYYMMRLFKQETGYTLGQYISQKRLLLAKELLSSGVPGTQVCYDCGFKDYSTFSRAYKQLFGVTPSGRTCP